MTRRWCAWLAIASIACGAAPIEPAKFESADRRLGIFARRLIAQRCLYGVDRNPVAVDLAKVSLWLVTLAKDHALTFLDHALRHGEEVALADLEEQVMLVLKVDVNRGRRILDRFGQAAHGDGFVALAGEEVACGVHDPRSCLQSFPFSPVDTCHYVVTLINTVNKVNIVS